MFLEGKLLEVVLYILLIAAGGLVLIAIHMIYGWLVKPLILRPLLWLYHKARGREPPAREPSQRRRLGFGPWMMSRFF